MKEEKLIHDKFDNNNNSCELTEAEVNVYASCDTHEKKACLVDCYLFTSFVTESL